jgi:hypothetical protein
MIETSSTFRAPPSLSPRTANYVAALIRQGDNFDYFKWLQTVREEESQKARLRQRLEKIRDAWDDFQASRARDAVYKYLQAVLEIVEHYKVWRRTNKLLRHAFEFAEQPLDRNADPFTAVIRCTCDDNVDNKTISKWARALRYASRHKKPKMRLKTFMKDAGGVNACAAGYLKLRRRSSRPNRGKAVLFVWCDAA